MGVYRWQGAVAPLADEDGLDGAVSYINGTAGVHVRRRNFRTSGGTPDCRRKQRLQLSNSGYNTGDCFIAAVLKHTCPLSKPTPLQIADLRAEARLPECGSATEGHMLQLLKHLSCCCVLVQPEHQSAIVLNAEAGTSRCVTMAMQGNRHVEPVIIHGTVQLRSLDEVVDQLQVCGIQMHLPASGPGHSLEEAVSISDDDSEQLQAENSADHAPCRNWRCDLLTMTVNLCRQGLCKVCCASVRCCSESTPLNPRPPSDDDPPQSGPPKASGLATVNTLPTEVAVVSTQQQSEGPAPGKSRSAKKRRRAARRKVRRLYQMMLAAPPQSPTPEVEMMGADITGSCLDDSLDDPNDHILARQQAGLDDETLRLVQMLAALPEQTHYLRARHDTVDAWSDDITSSDDEPAPEVQHVLCQPNSTDMLRRVGDDMWLGKVQLTQHVNDSRLEELCALAAGDMMSPNMPWIMEAAVAVRWKQETT